MDVDTISQTLQASKTRDKVYAKSVILKESCFQLKCKLLFLRTMERYNSLFLTLEIF